jgi:hypothetical protein
MAIVRYDSWSVTRDGDRSLRTSHNSAEQTTQETCHPFTHNLATKEPCFIEHPVIFNASRSRDALGNWKLQNDEWSKDSSLYFGGWTIDFVRTFGRWQCKYIARLSQLRWIFLWAWFHPQVSHPVMSKSSHIFDSGESWLRPLSRKEFPWGHVSCAINSQADDDLSRDWNVRVRANKRLNIFCPSTGKYWRFNQETLTYPPNRREYRRYRADKIEQTEIVTSGNLLWI